MLLPTSGTTSISLWDVQTTKEVLEDWLQASVGAFCHTQVLEVVEDHAYGVSLELTRARTTERVTQAAKENASKVATKVSGVVAARVVAVDERYRIAERVDYAVNAAATRAGQVTATASTVVEKVTTRAMENPAIASGVTTISLAASRGLDFLSRQLGLVSTAANQYNEQDSIRAVQPEDIHMPQVHLPAMPAMPSLGRRAPEAPPPPPQPYEPSFLGFEDQAQGQNGAPPSAPPMPRVLGGEFDEEPPAVELEAMTVTEAAPPQAQAQAQAAPEPEPETRELGGAAPVQSEDDALEVEPWAESEVEAQGLEEESDFLKEVAAIDDDFKGAA